MSSKATISTANFICAPATPAGARSAIAVIRASGGHDGRIFAALGDHFKSVQGFTTASLKPRTAYYGILGDGIQPIDDVILTRYDSPASFTGEDSFEISCHGNPLIQRRILELLFSLGFRMAEPGEFSRRAYLNGRIALDAAQAIGEIIEARSHMALKAAQRMQQGSFRRTLFLLRSELMNLLADLNAELDFIDEDISFSTRHAKLATLESTKNTAANLASDAKRYERFKDGVHIAIIGAPNAGKSSLLNRLIGHDRSIVSETAGTTRDYVEAQMELAGLNIRLFDTAGLRRDTSDSIEQIGIERTRELMNRAHICLLLVDGSAEPHADAFALADEMAATRVKVLNKCDALHPLWQGVAEDILRISAKTGEGVERLLRHVEQLVSEEAPSDALPLSLWQRNALLEIADRLNAASEAVSADELPEVVTHIVRQAIDKIAELTGDIGSEDILGRIFSRFCIGK